MLRFSAACPRAPEALAISYRLFADFDPQHKGLLMLRVGDETRSAIFSPEAASQRFVLGQPGTFDQFVQFFASGVEHIWTGYDHILFLISLLLPAALSRRGRSWKPRESFRAAASDVFRIVTAFTLAHSITLALATLQIVALPSRLTESAIAFSVVLAALNNVFPIIGGRRWAVAGAFGLVHGFGFASVLIDLGLPEAALALALAAFNLGVEAGQIAIVLVFLPVAWRLRHTPLYRRVVMTGGSLFIAMLAAMWLVERALYTKASLVLVTAS